MVRINKPDFYEGCDHRGLLEYVKVFRLFDPTPWIPGEDFAESFANAVRQSSRPLALWIDPNFRSGCLLEIWRIVIWVGVTVDGEEYVATFSVRATNSPYESHVFVEHPRGDYSMLTQLGLHHSAELEYDRERDVFLPKPLEDGSGIFPSVPSVKEYFH